ncbi:hypothetical protein FZEAL_9234 [Fusarium zealandicum]|uniref:Uncharacterized protein n=1 Tax=Fusarium zealandicum TaxID=1053134 RepID=A0A8H4XG11_9HYPO|nr:hypothetical protein FZEAL_9234 [Fusarium zealandicum]
MGDSDTRKVTSDGLESSCPIPYTFSYRNAPEDDRLQAQFMASMPETSHPNRSEAYGCHVKCVSIALSHGLTPAQYIPVTQYSYESFVPDDDRYRHLILHRMREALNENLGWLPAEIWSMVTQHLICDYAIAEISAIRPKTTFTIDVSGDVWATHVSIDCVDYISSLSNSPRAGSKLVWGATDSAAGHVVYISEDHLGIRQIIDNLADAPEKQQSLGPPWWRTVSVDDQKLAFISDGVKLRDSALWASTPRIFWSHPLESAELQSLSLYDLLDKPEARMIPLDLNEPDTIGYSLCWGRGKLLYIHAHKPWESLTFYHELDTKLIVSESSNYPEDCEIEHPNPGPLESPLEWIYHPLQQGELIDQVWIRQPQDVPCPSPSNGVSPKAADDMAIAFVTDRSRVLKTAPISHASGADKFPWVCIAKRSSAHPTRIFFSPSASGIGWFAAPTPSPNTTEPVPKEVLVESYDIRGYLCISADFHSSASLRDVVEVVVCRGSQNGSFSITGLLFRYANGNQACVGRFRFDCAEAPLKVENSPSLFVGMSGLDRGLPIAYVAAISLVPPEDRGEWTWLSVGWSKNLEWYHRDGSSIACYLAKDGWEVTSDAHPDADSEDGQGDEQEDETKTSEHLQG